MDRTIRGIFFDAGWTLFRPVNRLWFINLEFTGAVDAGVYASVPEERRNAVFDAAKRFLNDNQLLQTEEDEYEQFRVFYAMIADGLPELGLTRAATDKIAYGKVYNTENYSFFADTKPTLTRLRPDYRLGIISDTWPSIDRILRSGGVDGFFDTRTYSFRLGVSKPDPRIYHDALGRLGLPPEQTLFIDDREQNLDGAALCGINPVLIRTKPGAPDSGRYPHIDSLSELISLGI